MTTAAKATTNPNTTRCDVDPDTFGLAQEFIAKWYANDPHARRALKVETGFLRSSEILPRPMDSLEAPARYRCDGDGHSHYQHAWKRFTERLAGFGNQMHTLENLAFLRSRLGIEPVDPRRLQPFLGHPNCIEVPWHVQFALDATGMTPAMYREVRSRGTAPCCRGVSCFARFENEEAQKLLLEIHLAGIALAGLERDPELGPPPAEATEPEFLEGVDMARLIGFLSEANGHSFYGPESLLELGFDARVVDAMNRTHLSSTSDPMGMIYDMNDEPLESLTAVKCLDFLWILAIETNADITDAAWKNGRGTQARDLARAILAKVAAPADLAPINH
jgi:hypothetical protein